MSKPVDFAQVETLRRRMLISKVQMAKLLGVSRLTYYNWTHGKNQIRSSHERRVREVLRRLLAVIVDHEWPSSDVLDKSPTERFEILKALVSQYNEPKEEEVVAPDAPVEPVASVE